MLKWKKKTSRLESIPVLILLGLLAGAVGALGIGLIQLHQMSVSSSSSSSPNQVTSDSRIESTKSGVGDGDGRSGGEGTVARL